MRALLAFAILVLAGCTPAALVAAQTTVATAANAEVAGIKAFVAFDQQHRAAILAEATAGQKDRALDDLRAYEPQQAKVAAGFHALDGALVAANTTITAVAAKKLTLDSLAGVAASIMSAAQQVYSAAQLLGLDVPAINKLIGVTPATLPTTIGGGQ